VAYRSEMMANHTRKAVTPSRPLPADTKAAATAMDSTHLWLAMARNDATTSAKDCCGNPK